MKDEELIRILVKKGISRESAERKVWDMSFMPGPSFHDASIDAVWDIVGGLPVPEYCLDYLDRDPEEGVDVTVMLINKGMSEEDIRALGQTLPTFAPGLYAEILRDPFLKEDKRHILRQVDRVDLRRVLPVSIYRRWHSGSTRKSR